MPRKSSSTATPATPRKTRTRKTTTSRRKTASKVTKIEVAKVDTPVKVRPSQPNLKVADYLSDFKVRWKIHSYETTILWNQSKNLYTQTLKPSFDKSVVYVKDSYNKAFNNK